MEHRYKVSGMSCGSCEAKVKTALETLPQVSSASVSKDQSMATIQMEAHVPTADLQKALTEVDPKYGIELLPSDEMPSVDKKPWYVTYKPILLIFFYILGVVLLIEEMHPPFDGMRAMRHFMAGFFLVFSFFKMLDLKGFAETYRSYDVIAQKWPAWGYLYAFIELALGIAYLVNYNPIVTNTVTLIVMSISIIGVLQSVLDKRKIQCACLGTAFDLPMSTVTIIEDAMMIAMSAIMLINLM